MTKIGVTIPTGEKVEAEIVRFFDAYGKKYLVYTLNEKDEQGFVKLYVAKVDGAPKALVGSFIEDDNEWKVVKDEFKKIIGENSDSGSTTANDLNPSDLENVNVRGNRVIKLMESYVNLLSANQKQFTAPVAPAQPVTPEPSPMGFGYPMPGMEAAYQPTPEPTPSVPEPEMPQAPVFPGMPPYQAPVQPEMPTMDFERQSFGPKPTYQEPMTPFPQMPEYTAPVESVQPAPTMPASSNYEQMYNDLKEKFDRCNAELEKVTNENIELRIKIDDIREILNEN